MWLLRLVLWLLPLRRLMSLWLLMTAGNAPRLVRLLVLLPVGDLQLRLLCWEWHRLRRRCSLHPPPLLLLLLLLQLLRHCFY